MKWSLGSDSEEWMIDHRELTFSEWSFKIMKMSEFPDSKGILRSENPMVDMQKDLFLTFWDLKLYT